MRIGLYHGYELTGSGSNEYTRYLAQYFVKAGHETHIICREESPERFPFISHLHTWTAGGEATTFFGRPDQTSACHLHRLPHGEVRPVYLTDKQRPGNVKSFTSLSDDELRQYHQLNEKLLSRILSSFPLDILHANHLVYQPSAALGACETTGTPLVIFPHGSSIEYTIRQDPRYRRLALEALLGSAGMIVGNREVRDRILALYPEHRESILEKTRIVGVGVDTSLFSPIHRTERRQSIRMLAEMGGNGGKTPVQKEELTERLQRGDVSAVQGYWNAYDHSLPDTDLVDQLQDIPWEDNILLYVGALTVGKGVQSMIAALPAILRDHPKTHLLIVGAGAYREVLEAMVHAVSTSDLDLLHRLCDRGHDLDRNEQTGPWEDVRHYLADSANMATLASAGKDLDRHVHFLGRLDHSRLCRLFPCADLSLFPSLIPEAYPLVVMESLANGVLPLVTYFSGFKDSVDDLERRLGKSLADSMKIPLDARARIGTIASQVKRLLGDRPLRDTGSMLRQIAVEDFDWSLRVSQMTDAYEFFIERGGYGRRR